MWRQKLFPEAYLWLESLINDSFFCINFSIVATTKTLSPLLWRMWRQEHFGWTTLHFSESNKHVRSQIMFNDFFMWIKILKHKKRIIKNIYDLKCMFIAMRWLSYSSFSLRPNVKEFTDTVTTLFMCFLAFSFIGLLSIKKYDTVTLFLTCLNLFFYQWETSTQVKYITHDAH